MSLRQVKVSSFVSLQKALYFNCLYSLIFGASLIAQCIYKMSYLMISAPARAFVPALTVTWCAVEILRLYVGSTGNLNESVRCGKRLRARAHKTLSSHTSARPPPPSRRFRPCAPSGF